MKKILILFCVMILHLGSTAQFLTQSAEGKGSIPLPLAGIGVGVDIGKVEITFGLNNYDKALSNVSNKNNWMLGLNLTAKNSEGFANLFSGGDIVPAGDFLGFFGRTWTNNATILANWNSSSQLAALQDDRLRQAAMYNLYKKDIITAVTLSVAKIAVEAEASKVEGELQLLIAAANDSRSLDRKVADYQKAHPEESLKAFWVEMKELQGVAKRNYIENYNKVFTPDYEKAQAKGFREFMKQQKVMRFTPFILGGINARNFSLYAPVTPVNFSKSFKDTLYRGGTIGLGVNVQVKNFWFGITYSYLDGDNFTALRSKEYTLKTVDTSGNQSLTSEKKTTAYPGKYSKVVTNPLSADIIWDYKLGDSTRMLTNLYLRASLHSRDTAYLKNYTNIGIGTYFLGKKSKFSGGLYIELPDVNNNFEKAKPADEINIRPVFKRLTFGIVTKYAFSSILGNTNRQRKPDT